MDRYSCPFPDCTKAYKCKLNLNRHLSAIHAENKRFQCNICEKALSSSQNLNEHLRLHSKLLPFVCKEKGCGKRFRHGSQFSAHKRIHNFIWSLLDKGEFLKTHKVFGNELGNVFQLSSQTKEICQNEEKLKLPILLSSQEFKLPEL